MALANNGTGNGTEVKKTDRLDLGESSTQGDIWPGGAGAGMGLGGTFSFYLSPYGFANLTNQLLPDLPPYWSKARDALLSTTIDWEDFWAGAISIAITKAAAMDFEVKAINDLMARRGQELFNDANGQQGWGHYLSVDLQDYLLTDNGCFTEIDRVDNSKPGSKVVGLYHLDSLRCYRTGDPDTPVIYQDLHGQYHYLHWWQVFDISDMPNPRNNYFGVGRCAASRAYRRIRRRVAANLFDYQKMSGGRPTELNFIGGITPQQLENILKTNEADRQARGMTVYGGAAIISMMTKDAISNVRVPIAEKPDKFDEEVELEHAAIEYANAIGLDKADIKPLTGAMAGTATQSQIQHDKAAGKGLALWRKRFSYFMSNYVLPNQASFHFVEVDLGQLKQEADIFAAYATALAGAVGKDGTVMDHNQAIQFLVDKNQLSREYLPNGQDLTPGVSLDDEEKPIFSEQDLMTQQVIQQVLGQPAQQQSQVQQPAPSTGGQ